LLCHGLCNSVAEILNVFWGMLGGVVHSWELDSVHSCECDRNHSWERDCDRNHSWERDRRHAGDGNRNHSWDLSSMHN
jgi:hypothetical protein